MWLAVSIVGELYYIRQGARLYNFGAQGAIDHGDGFL